MTVLCRAAAVPGDAAALGDALPQARRQGAAEDGRSLGRIRRDGGCCGAAGRRASPAMLLRLPPGIGRQHDLSYLLKVDLLTVS